MPQRDVPAPALLFSHKLRLVLKPQAVTVSNVWSDSSELAAVCDVHRNVKVQLTWFFRNFQPRLTEMLRCHGDGVRTLHTDGFWAV